MNEEKEGKERKGREVWREERNGGGKKKMGCTRASGIRKAKQNRSKKNNNIESNSAYEFTRSSGAQSSEFLRGWIDVEESRRKTNCKRETRFAVGFYRLKLVPEIEITV